MRRLHALGCDVLGARATLGPRGRRSVVLGAGGVTPWDNAASYTSGDVVYNDRRYFRALRDISPPFLPSLFDGEVPGKSDAWREISEAQAYAQTTTAVFGARTKQTLVGATIDVEGLQARLDSLPSTNKMVHTIWVGHGLPLVQRIVGDAQKMLNEAIVPTAEFSFHSQVMDMSKAANALDDKIQKLPYDDGNCPVWDDVKNFFVNASRLANLLEGTIDQTLKWSDVKSAANEAAHGASKALDNAASTAKWTTGLLVGGAVVLGLGVLYAGYKIVASPTGGAIVGGYLGGVRRP